MNEAIECLPPVSDANARILILGSKPGKASRRTGQYYADNRDHFWKIMGAIYGFSPDLPYDARMTLLKTNGIALWDVIQSCTRADPKSDTENEKANDFDAFFLDHPHIEKVFFNGVKTELLFRALCPPLTAKPLMPYMRLPSTIAPGITLTDKIEVWAQTLKEPS